MSTFVDYDHHHHRHSGVGRHTSAGVHDGIWRAIAAHRQAVLGRPATPTPGQRGEAGGGAGHWVGRVDRSAGAAKDGDGLTPTRPPPVLTPLWE